MSTEVASRAVDPEVESMVKDIGLPPCPKIIMDFMQEMRRDEPDFRKLSGLVSSDVALSAAVLKTANSALYGLRTKATTVQQACTLLGLKATAFLISGLLLRRAFPVDKSKAIEELWRVASGTATIAGLLARKFSGVDRDSAYTYALFRDCGLAVLLPKYPDYASIVDGSARTDGSPITLVENTRYSVNHARVGFVLAQSWQLPEALCEAIRHHHNWVGILSGKTQIGKPSTRLIVLGLLAEQLYSQQTRQKGCNEWALGKALVQSELGVNEEALGSLLEMMTKAAQDA
jgi:HD-like signal output (HDOD) protein